ncbi:molybdenum cofactor guanylyltransferase [Corynebacterium sp.]|uniref:molybdenum cofactor guanylyltransferase n=1 Tax=Corynebacterium sp. TaxID=1720 RepID=UPI0026DD0FDE|nr:NTP transferase domain-containing protein [Corynebacterium sp.]MDO5031949.1 NTP transferase domain-containing protein [Corynebacterium sp.]
MLAPALGGGAGLGAIIVAGGRGSRMGGVDKASVRVGGVRMLDRLMHHLPYGADTVVVSPHWLGTPQVCETPLYGGPAAGIAAGYRFLAARSSASRVAVLAVDAPESPLVLPQLLVALEKAPAVEAAVAANQGQLQPLCALWQAEALGRAITRLGEVHNRSARSLLRAAGPLAVVPVGEEIRDYDTLTQLRAYEHRVTGA